MKNSKRKGADGERELARLLREYGFETRRGQQYCGANGDADVVGLPYIHIECKRVEKLNLREAMQQAVSDSAGLDIMPTVFHRKNGEKWQVTMNFKDWIEIYKEYYSGKEMANLNDEP